MTNEIGGAQTDGRDEAVATGVVTRLYLLMALPFVGVLVFALGGLLTMRAFSHNNSLDCLDPVTVGAFNDPTTCTHYSYVLPVVVGVLGVVLLLGGGLAASYYAARRIGVPAYLALRRGRRSATS